MKLRSMTRRYTRRHATQVTASLLKQLPAMLGLLFGLLRDRRVSAVEKGLFALVLFYIVTPADLLPDILGPLGFVDDFYLLALALGRLLSRASPDVLLEHWRGDPKELGFLVEGVDQLGAGLPGRIRRALRRLSRSID